jgi:transcriptional regulator with XRE-family HTH domain
MLWFGLLISKSFGIRPLQKRNTVFILKPESVPSRGGEMTVGQEIRRRREERGWSQAKLGVLSGTGPSGISQIETGRRNPNAGTLQRIAEALEVEVRDLFPLEQPRLPDVPPGQAYFVPLEEDEEEDTVTLQIYYVQLFEGNEPILKAMRKASPDEEATIRKQLEKSERSRE